MTEVEESTEALALKLALATLSGNCISGSRKNKEAIEENRARRCDLSLVLMNRLWPVKTTMANWSATND